MAQFARPSADTYRDAWEEDDGGIVTIYDQIDEVAADDADYIRTPLAPSNDVYVSLLTTVDDPLVSTGHVLRYRYGKDAASGGQINITVQLREGYVNEGAPGTLIVEQVHTDVGIFPIAGSITLSGGEADSITDYTDLYLRLVANQV